jgi:nicotinamide mononucleotide adenylyltransferase
MVNDNHKEWSLVLGRFQCKPPHAGHLGIINKLLEEGKNVLIGLRATDGSKKNPYGFASRAIHFQEIYKKEIAEGRVMVQGLPDITEVAHGRKVGWKVREVKLEPEIEAISATEIRKKAE